MWYLWADEVNDELSPKNNKRKSSELGDMGTPKMAHMSTIDKILQIPEPPPIREQTKTLNSRR